MIRNLIILITLLVFFQAKYALADVAAQKIKSKTVTPLGFAECIHKNMAIISGNQLTMSSLLNKCYTSVPYNYDFTVTCKNPMQQPQGSVSVTELTLKYKTGSRKINFDLTVAGKVTTSNSCTIANIITCPNNITIKNTYVSCISGDINENNIFSAYYPGETIPTYYKCLRVLDQPAFYWDSQQMHYTQNYVKQRIKNNLQPLWSAVTTKPSSPNDAKFSIITPVNQCQSLNDQIQYDPTTDTEKKGWYVPVACIDQTCSNLSYQNQSSNRTIKEKKSLRERLYSGSNTTLGFQFGVPSLTNPYQANSKVYAYSSDTEIWPGYIENGVTMQYGVGTWLRMDYPENAEIFSVKIQDTLCNNYLQSIEGGVQIKNDISNSNNPYYRIISSVCYDFDRTKFISLSPNILIRRAAEVAEGAIKSFEDDGGIQLPKCNDGSVRCFPGETSYNWSCNSKYIPPFDSAPNNACSTTSSRVLRARWQASTLPSEAYNTTVYFWTLALNNQIIGFLNPDYLDDFFPTITQDSFNKLTFNERVNMQTKYSLAHNPVAIYPGFSLESIIALTITDKDAIQIPKIIYGSGIYPKDTPTGMYGRMLISIDKEVIGNLIANQKFHPLSKQLINSDNIKNLNIQFYNITSLKQYKQSTPKCIGHYIDIAGYGSAVIPTYYFSGPGGCTLTPIKTTKDIVPYKAKPNTAVPPYKANNTPSQKETNSPKKNNIIY